ncbi:MAG: hypothetical protein KAV25_02500 [Methanophagales archaeon]|nr:hypothetical protein [Methanophagales archaeon]
MELTKKDKILICCILAWGSLFALIRYTRGMKLTSRIVYLSHPRPNNEFWLSMASSTSLEA